MSSRLAATVVAAFAVVCVAASAAAPATAPLSIPNQLESAITVDKVNHTVTLPLYKGISHGGRVWFVLTESSDLNEAVRLGINWAPKLANALGTAAVQHAELSGGELSRTSVVHFAGTVGFSGQRVVIPGPDLF